MTAIMDRWRGFMAWAMVPLVLVAARPAAGCICSDGQFKPICQMQIGRDRFASIAVKAEGHDRSCGCRTMCEAAGQTGPSGSAGEPVVRSACHCHCLSQDPLLVISVPIIPAADTLLAVPPATHRIADPSASCSSFRGAVLDTGPPFDIVVAFRRLII